MTPFVSALCALSVLAAAKPSTKPAPSTPTTTATTTTTTAAPPACAEPAAPPKPRVVRVMLPDLETSGSFQVSKQALTQIVAETAGAVHGYELLSSAEVRAVLDQESNKQLLGCSATSCLAELAEALDADLIVSGRVEPTADGAALVSLSLVNARAIVVVNRVNVTWRGADNRVPDVVRTSSQRLLVDAADRKPGALVLANAPEGARITVDGADRTADHSRGKITLDVGVHDVSVDAPGYLTLNTGVIVESEKDTPLDATLSEPPTSSAWLIAGGAVALVAGAAATGAILYLSGDSTVTLSASAPGAGVDDVEALRALGRK